MIYPFSGNDLNVPRDDNHILCEWRGNGRIVFSFSMMGNAISAHFASGPKSLRYIKGAIEEFSDHIKVFFPWCTMILANIDRPSVIRLVKKCGFGYVASYGKCTVYARIL